MKLDSDLAPELSSRLRVEVRRGGRAVGAGVGLGLGLALILTLTVTLTLTLTLALTRDCPQSSSCAMVRR
jgi:hypothetical protein